MKKPPKRKRVAPRRKPLRQPGAARPATRLAARVLPSQVDFDRLEARDRAMRAAMPPAVREEWDRLMATDEEPGPDQQARLEALLDQYDTPVSASELERHVADIRREREAKAGPDPATDGMG